MNIKKIINPALTVMGLALVAAGAQAQTVEEFASVSGGNNTYMYTSGAGGGLTMTAGGFAATYDIPVVNSGGNSPVTLSFSGAGVLTNNGNTATTAIGPNTFFDQSLKGGNFTITDTATSTILLSGSFTGADLSGFLGTTQAGVDTNFTNVAYTGGTYATRAGLLLGATPLDKFNFQLIAVKPLVTPPTGLSVTGGYLNSFNSAGNGQFTGVTTVPEPASIIPFALGGLGLLGLIARKTRRTGGAAA